MLKIQVISCWYYLISQKPRNKATKPHPKIIPSISHKGIFRVKIIIKNINLTATYETQPQRSTKNSKTISPTTKNHSYTIHTVLRRETQTKDAFPAPRDQIGLNESQQSCLLRFQGEKHIRSHQRILQEKKY